MVALQGALDFLPMSGHNVQRAQIKSLFNILKKERVQNKRAKTESLAPASAVCDEKSFSIVRSNVPWNRFSFADKNNWRKGKLIRSNDERMHAISTCESIQHVDCWARALGNWKLNQTIVAKIVLRCDTKFDYARQLCAGKTRITGTERSSHIRPVRWRRKKEERNKSEEKCLRNAIIKWNLHKITKKSANDECCAINYHRFAANV